MINPPKKPSKNSYARLEKIHNKLKTAIKNEDIDMFKKWHEISIKEQMEYRFNPFVIKTAKELVAECSSGFFKSFLMQTKPTYHEDDICELISKTVRYQKYKSYDIIKDNWSELFYSNKYFKTNLLNNIYLYEFNHDLKNILDLVSEDKLKFSCDIIHLNGFKSVEITNELFKKLSPSRRYESYLINLKKSIENNKVEDISYFFFALTDEFSINEKDNKELIKSCYNKVNNSLSGLSYLLSQKIVVNILEQEMMSKGGEFFNYLWEKYKLKTCLEEITPEKTVTVKKMKI